MAYPYFKRWERLVLLVSVYTMYTGISPASWSCYSFSACFMLFAKHHAMNFTWGCNISAFSDQDTLDCVSFCLFIDRYYYCLLVAVHSSTFCHLPLCSIVFFAWLWLRENEKLNKISFEMREFTSSFLKYSLIKSSFASLLHSDLLPHFSSTGKLNDVLFMCMIGSLL